LHIAARRCDNEVVKLLMYNGADVNAKKRSDNTPLLMAALEGREQLENLLNAKGAYVTDDIVTYLRELEKLKGLMEGDANIDSRYLSDATPLHLVALDGNKELAEFLIAKGANVNARCSFGETPLHFAAGGGHAEAVELLVAKGANVNAKDYQGKTPFWWAREKGHKNIVELLRRHGVDE